jgi:hypothetical protein
MISFDGTRTFFVILLLSRWLIATPPDCSALWSVSYPTPQRRPLAKALILIHRDRQKCDGCHINSGKQARYLRCFQNPSLQAADAPKT